jgi:hypothetical protein
MAEFSPAKAARNPKIGPTSKRPRLSQPSAKRQNPRHNADSEWS